MTRDLKAKFTRKINIIAVYVAHEDDTKENKNLFWVALMDFKENTTNTTLTLGDFNVRVGTKY